MPERYVVVGGGLAGLMTVIKLAEAGKHVDIFSIVPVKRSHSVCAQGGINGAVNTKGEGDHPDIHVKDTLKGGDFLAEQPPVRGMCYAAPAIIYLLDRMGVPFNRTNSTGSANGRSYMDGAIYANAEFIQVHPTAIPGEDKHRLMSESARGEGGRIWVPKQKGDKRAGKDIPDNERWFFLEEKYPKYGNLVPRDVASREIFSVVKDLGMGVSGEDVVYLDVSHIPEATLDRKLGGIMEIYEKFQGVDPRHNPMKIFPAVHYSMGGLWSDYEADSKNNLVAGSPRQQSTNIPGLYATGECDYAYHGANRLGANSLLSCIYAGMIGGPAMISYAKNAAPKKGDIPAALLQGAKQQWVERFDKIYAMQGSENPYQIGKVMGELMVKSATVVKVNSQLDQALGTIQEMKQRWKRCNVLDTGRTVNQSAAYVNQLWNMLDIAHLILKASRLRDESRGSHYKPEFTLPKVKEGRRPQEDAGFMAAWKARNDKWLKNSMGSWTPDGPRVEFKPLESLKNPILAPEPRHYD